MGAQLAAMDPDPDPAVVTPATAAETGVPFEPQTVAGVPQPEPEPLAVTPAVSELTLVMPFGPQTVTPWTAPVTGGVAGVLFTVTLAGDAAGAVVVLLFTVTLWGEAEGAVTVLLMVIGAGELGGGGVSFVMVITGLDDAGG